MKRRFPLQVHISTLFLILMLLVGGVLGSLGYSVSRQILASTADELTTRIHRETLDKFSGLLAPATVATRLLSRDAIVGETTLAGRMRNLPFVQALLSSSSAMTSLYVAYDDGDFFMLRRLETGEDASLFKAPPGTHFVLQSIEHEAARAPSPGRHVYLGAGLEVLGEQDLPDYALRYDPRQRSWYKDALASDGVVTTTPYRFYTTGRAGVTVAQRSARAGVVVGADIRLETLDALLVAQRMTPGSRLALVNARGEVVASDRARSAEVASSSSGDLALPQIDATGFPVLGHLKRFVQATGQDSQVDSELDVEGRLWRTAVRPFMPDAALPIFLVTAIPDDELMAEAQRLLRYLALAMAVVILVAVPATFFLARRISRDLTKLAGEADAVRRFEFDRPIGVESMVLEVSQLASAMASAKRTIQRFMDISLAVASEKNFGRLLPRLLGETISAAEAEAGILYLVEGEQLVPSAWLTASGEVPALAEYGIAKAQVGPLLGKALSSGRPQTGAISDADRRALGIGDWSAGLAGPQGIAVPLLNRQHELVGAMVLFRAAETDLARLRFVEALSGTAAVSLESKELIHAQKVLFESFIQLIASAIDAKSPYTGGHCARVPALSKMLAEAVCAEKSGTYADFDLDDDGWEAVHVAAWLHDCGKVTTPEYVVDKATKLETIYDRIHEVRMRFEVLKRDAEIEALRAVASGMPEAEAMARRDAAWAQLDDDFAFIATCNEGGEFMAPERIERLNAIAVRTWVRTLDDRIGISHEEKARKAATPAAPLPVAEPLLANKPEHQLARRPNDLLPPDNPLGIKMPMPELLYDRGEVSNLAVARGTLSGEERYKINDHIVQTLVMLNQLPFPKHLREVPEIAGGHHEKMDGSGYPKRLTRAEMSPQARMIAIADIFEALTAVDRPYKQGKKLSESIRIMASMKREQHIDPELFDIFLRAGVYRRYAECYMKPEQIDDVEIEAYLG